MLLKEGSRGEDVRRLQAGLNQATAAGLDADGIFGVGTSGAVREFQHINGLDVDGLVGDKTWTALFDEIYAPQVEHDQPIAEDPNDWRDARYSFDVWDGPEEHQPKSRANLYSMYGSPGKGTADEAWAKANIVYCHPRGNREPLPGHESFEKEFWVAIHTKVEPYLREAMRRANEVCPGYVKRIGGYVFRHQRHDTDRPLSDHSWGVAVDINAADNRGKSYKRGTAPEPWSSEWWEVWPKGIPQGVVAAFESCGFEWGGRWSTFRDGMHASWSNRNSTDQV